MRRAARIVLIASVAMAAACGSETPSRAVYSLAHDLEHGVVDGACSRIYPAAGLPPETAGKLGLKPAGTTRRVDPDIERRACTRRLAVPAAVSALGFHEPRVRSVEELAVADRGDISAAAQASVAFDGAPPVPIPLVKAGGTWRVVIALDDE